MLRIILLCLLSTTTVLCADIENYFKKIDNKTSGHSMKNIDFIYTINLDQRPEKFAQCQQQLNPYGIFPFRFSAVNGWELSIEAITNLGVRFSPEKHTSDHMGTSYLPGQNFEPAHGMVQEAGRTYFGHCMSRGAIGIVLSHLSILQDAYNSKYNTIWVMEDDIQVIKDPRTLSSLVDKLNKAVGKRGWDILFTDQDTKDRNGNYVRCLSYAWRPNFTPANPGRFAERTVINADFEKVGARYGAYSMIVKRSGMRKILQFLKRYQIFLPYDMEFYLPENIKMYAVRDDVVSTIPTAASDNGSPNYQKKDTENKAVDAEFLKKKVFDSMKQLEGWCSFEKAGILIDMILKEKPKVVVEIGVWGGKSLIPMAYAAKANKSGHVYGIDPWSANASAAGMDGTNLAWWSSVNHENIYQGLVSKITQFGLQKRVTLIRNTSLGAPIIENIGLLHIDGNHSEEAAYVDVTKWVPLVKSGGLVIFDDVNWSTTGKAVSWLNEHCTPQFQVTGDNIWGVWRKP